MAQQQGLAFTSGGEAQEALGNPAEPTESHHDQLAGDKPSSGKAFEQLRRFSSTKQRQKAAETGGITSRQAIFPSQVRQVCLCTLTAKSSVPDSTVTKVMSPATPRVKTSEST